MPRIPVNYRKYLVSLLNRGDPPYRYTKEVMAPSRREALRYFNAGRGYMPEAQVEDIGEMYGPYLPAEQRMMDAPGFNDAYISELKRRKEELWREYMEEEDPAPGIGWPVGKAEQLDKEFEAQARYELDEMLENSRSNLPVLEKRYIEHIRRPGLGSEYYDWNEDAVRDRLRLRGDLRYDDYIGPAFPHRPMAPWQGR